MNSFGSPNSVRFLIGTHFAFGREESFKEKLFFKKVLSVSIQPNWPAYLAFVNRSPYSDQIAVKQSDSIRLSCRPPSRLFAPVYGRSQAEQERSFLSRKCHQWTSMIEGFRRDAIAHSSHMNAERMCRSQFHQQLPKIIHRVKCFIVLSSEICWSRSLVRSWLDTFSSFWSSGGKIAFSFFNSEALELDLVNIEKF